MASGDLYLMKRSTWNKKYLSIEPNRCGLSTMILFGESIILYYSDSEKADWDESDPALTELEKLEYLSSILEKQVNGVYKGYSVPEKFVISKNSKGGYFDNEFTLNINLLIEEVDKLRDDSLTQVGKVLQGAREWFFKNAEQICCWT